MNALSSGTVTSLESCREKLSETLADSYSILGRDVPSSPQILASLRTCTPVPQHVKDTCSSLDSLCHTHLFAFTPGILSTGTLFSTLSWRTPTYPILTSSRKPPVTSLGSSRPLAYCESASPLYCEFSWERGLPYLVALCIPGPLQ
jgi:hypothetical protein